MERAPSHDIAAVLSEISFNFEHLFASFMIDTQGVIRYRPDRIRRELKTVAMTSRALKPNANPIEREKLRLATTVAAGNMPKPEVMEIWWGDTHRVSVFRYDTTTSTKISWRGTWTIEFGPLFVVA